MTGEGQCAGACGSFTYDACTCDPTDPCGWAGDGYCDVDGVLPSCADLATAFDDSADCTPAWLFWSAWQTHIDEMAMPTGVDYDRYFGSALSDAHAQLAAQLPLLDPDDYPTAVDKLAFWIDVYNALLLTEAAWDYDDDLLYSVADYDFAVFKDRVHSVGGLMLSLDLIQHVVLRGDTSLAQWATLSAGDQATLLGWHADVFPQGSPDERAHFALHSAAKSSPDLTGAYAVPPALVVSLPTLDERLDAATDAFLSDSARGAGANGISRLFLWYGPDFGDVPAFLAAHGASGADASKYLAWDWALDHDDN